MYAWHEESIEPAFETRDLLAQVPATMRFVEPAAVEVQEFTDPVATLDRSEEVEDEPLVAQASPESTASEPVVEDGESEIGDDVEDARITRGSPPSYPKVALRMGWEGSVLCAIELDADGEVLAVEIVESSGYEVLDEAARKAIREWRFAAATRAGEPVAGRLEHRVSFRIKG